MASVTFCVLWQPIWRVQSDEMANIRYCFKRTYFSFSPFPFFYDLRIIFFLKNAEAPIWAIYRGIQYVFSIIHSATRRYYSAALPDKCVINKPLKATIKVCGALLSPDDWWPGDTVVYSPGGASDHTIPAQCVLNPKHSRGHSTHTQSGGGVGSNSPVKMHLY